MSNVQVIKVECPGCKRKVSCTPLFYEPSLGEFDCDCGIKGTAEIKLAAGTSYKSDICL